VLEEFGVSSDFAAAAHAARYYRHVLHNSLLAGATGWIAWNNTDFALPSQEPYFHKAFEQNFGLTDVAGAPKPTLGEMGSFGAMLTAIGASRCGRADTDVALVVPAYMDTAFPFSSSGDRTSAAKTLAQAYVSARLADLPPSVARESDGISAGALLYLLPSVKQLLAPTAAVLERLAFAGACVYLSYSAGENDWHRGPSYGRLNELFGVVHQLDAGLGDPIEDEVASFTFARDFGGIARGCVLRFRVAGNSHGRAFLPVSVSSDAEILATDAHGRPALVLRRLGAGSLVLCTYPVELMAANTPAVNPDDTVSLYRALAAHAGVISPVTVDDPRVACDVLVRDDGTRFAFLVSHAAEELVVKPVLAGHLVSLTGEEVNGSVTLTESGVGVFRMVDPRIGS
jgi:endo-1,4-beta-mannosidase